MNPTYGTYNAATNKLPVYLEGKHVGDIRAHAWGWYYVPAGETKGGNTFSTIPAVKNSLSMEESNENCERIADGLSPIGG